MFTSRQEAPVDAERTKRPSSFEPRLRRIPSALIALVFLAGPAAVFASACNQAPPPPPPLGLGDDDDDKPKKKKNKKVADDNSDDDTTGDIGSAQTAAPTGTTLTFPTATATKTATTNTDKQKLMACCTALHNAAVAAHAAENAANAAKAAGLPPPPAAPPASDVDKQAQACDSAVNNFTGDLNSSLSKIKGASPIALPTGCAI